MRLRVKAKIAGRMSDLDIFLQENVSKVVPKDRIIAEIGETGFEYLLNSGFLSVIDGKRLKYRVTRKSLGDEK